MFSTPTTVFDFSSLLSIDLQNQRECQRDIDANKLERSLILVFEYTKSVEVRFSFEQLYLIIELRLHKLVCNLY